MFAGAGRTPHTAGATFAQLERELIGLPQEGLEGGGTRLYGITQEEIDGMARLEEGAWRGFMGKSNRGAEIVANMDWFAMTDKEFLEHYPLLKAISRQNCFATQGAGVLGMDAQLSADPRNADFMGEFGDAADMINYLMTYADARANSIAGLTAAPEVLMPEIAADTTARQTAFKANKQARSAAAAAAAHAPAAAPVAALPPQPAPVVQAPQQPDAQPAPLPPMPQTPPPQLSQWQPAQQQPPTPASQQAHTPQLPPLASHRRPRLPPLASHRRRQ